ncbi:hypothetical protein [Anatilimnocola floriformis]|uniref:hypothetical protein n=1 Tax=Anatilimnocola floriformis TaxID=2948575 RepID=UPI0020C3DE92|nr:hypothetical protein [Anatilimnocola floriformis]
MGNVSLTWAEAAAIARQRAETLIAGIPGGDMFYHRCTYPSPAAVDTPYPVRWQVVFAPVPPQGSVIDGGYMALIVNLRDGTVTQESEGP